MERKEITLGTFFFSSPTDFLYLQTENKVCYEFILQRVVAVSVGVWGFYFLFIPVLTNFALLERVVTQKGGSYGSCKEHNSQSEDQWWKFFDVITQNCKFPFRFSTALSQVSSDVLERKLSCPSSGTLLRSYAQIAQFIGLTTEKYHLSGSYSLESANSRLKDTHESLFFA